MAAPLSEHKGVVTAKLEGGPIWRMVAISSGWRYILDIHIEKTDLNNDIFLIFKRNSNIINVICDYFLH